MRVSTGINARIFEHIPVWNNRERVASIVRPPLGSWSSRVHFRFIGETRLSPVRSWDEQFFDFLAQILHHFRRKKESVWKRLETVHFSLRIESPRIDKNKSGKNNFSELISAFSRPLNYSDRSIGPFRARVFNNNNENNSNRCERTHTPFVSFIGRGRCNWLITRADRKSWLIEIRKMIDAPLLCRYPRLCYALSSPFLWNPFSFYYQTSWSISQTGIGNNLYQFRAPIQLSNVCRIGNNIHLAMEWKIRLLLFSFPFLLFVNGWKKFSHFRAAIFFLKRSFEISITFIINFKVSVFQIILFIKYESGIFFVDKIKFETEYRYQKIAKHEQAKYSLVRSFDVTLIDLTIC